MIANRCYTKKYVYKNKHARQAANKNSPNEQQCRSHSMHTKQQPMANCNKCGGQHKKAQCPAYGNKCMTCQRYHHFSKVCFYNKGKAIHVTKLQDDESRSEFKYAGEL